jgi:lysophospholipase L1-like esterase
VDPADTYPARLQRKLSRWPQEVTVLNAGVPGMNSSQIAAAFPQMLDRFQPSAVLLMVGVADFWNLDSFDAEDYSGWRWLLWGGGWWDRSRVVKLARLIRFNLEHGRDEVPAEQPSVEHTPYNWKIGGGGEGIDVDIDMHFDDGIKDILVFRRQLRRNLSLIAARAQARGIPLILMTYPTEGGFYAAVNEVHRQFAAAGHLPLIDLAAQTANWSRPPLLAKAYFPDFHPRRAGYELSARIIERELGPLLAGSEPLEGGVH